MRATWQIIMKEALDPQLLALLKQDSMKARKPYGKGFNEQSRLIEVRQGHKYCITQHSNDPDDITIEIASKISTY